MTPYAALREEPGSGSLARGRPHFIHRSLGRETHTRKGSVRPFWTPDLRAAILMDACLTSC